MKNAVFLDRDGVINDNTHHVNRPEDLILYPWTTQAIRRLNQAGFLVLVTTNQGGIEMGHFTEADLQAIHHHLDTLLQQSGVTIDDYSYCPHYYSPCDCRKPKPGMIQKLAQKYDINLHNSWMVGDRESDIQAGAAAGCQTIKLGHQSSLANYTCQNLSEATDYILKNNQRFA